MKTLFKKYQFIYWPDFHGFKFIKLDPNITRMAFIYKWCLFLGFWEIRKWVKDK